LKAHHGERKSGGGAINNACPSCSWFSSKLKDWPKWNGQLPKEADAGTRVEPSSSRGGTQRGRASGTGSMAAPRSPEQERIQLAMALNASTIASVETNQYRDDLARAMRLSLLET